jgi:hypothetical protein
MRPNEMEQTEAMLRLWGDARWLDEERGLYPGKVRYQRDAGGAKASGGGAPMRPETDEVRAHAERVDKAMEGLAPLLRRLLRLRYRMGWSDDACRRDDRFKALSYHDFRLLRLNALELLAGRLVRQ